MTRNLLEIRQRAAPAPTGLAFWKGLARPIPLIAALVLFVVAGVNVGALTIMLSQREDTLSHVREDARNLVALLAAQSDRVFEAVGLVEDNIVEKLDTVDVRSAPALRLAAQRRFLHDMLVAGATSLKALRWLSILDDRADMVSTSRQFPAPRFDLRGRDYVRALSRPDGPKTFVSEPVPNRDDGRLTMFLARKMENARGEFIGILIAGIEADYFRKIFDRVDLHPTSDLYIEREDGVLLSSRSLSPDRADAERVGTPDDRSIEVSARLSQHPVRVVLRQDRDVVLSDWRDETLFVAGMVAAVDLSVLLAGIAGIRHIRQTRRSGEVEHYLARHDTLTGLPNRACFQERLDQTLRACEDADWDFGLLLLDLDRFKEVNDSLGHQAGDELLNLVTARLKSCLGPQDFLARLGGDEFAIIVDGVRTSSTLSRFGALALGQFQAPFVVRGRTFSVGVSIGVALGSAHKDAKHLFDQADMALYQAKESGRGTIRFFSADLSAARMERNTLAQDIAEAVREETFELHFQPVMDLRTCQLAGFEALLRWNDPVRGSVPPSTFIPIAEETGAIGPLGTFVLREACRAAASWPAHLAVAVNLSAVQLQFGDVAEGIAEALRDSGLAPQRLEIEITESVLLDQPSARATLRALVERGISISLDDFGTGYSSLSYLRSFPFGRIKIDRSFVAEMLDNREAAAIVQTVKDLGGRLGMAVTAEGIETHAQLRLLQSMGCDCGQGYLISRPMPADEVSDFIARFGTEAASPNRLLARAVA